VANSTATATALLPAIGHEQASKIAVQAARTGCSVRELAREAGIDGQQFEQLTSATAVCRLGFVPPVQEKKK
jgi:aspartate ammonia-lyase